ncbi:MAG: hypothetical protein A2X28_04350 [Elusimicrobia bacterium GWA2_56_46]|jgi:hypothetical protein|nr:MAG: hypothetical protein A2X28_04350 [Elusimicrobia bacterium GWA2_56_46]OGR56107.1 MAG: hypothetical protein A2X39_07770 [Elusimicrobia bacterium GWC2_56_31]HBB66149.1 hypothetical protein [Elusimicrobiota bacterium]HBW22943.1 hypothetical protein [Elusimicrobiota bacterium]
MGISSPVVKAKSPKRFSFITHPSSLILRKGQTTIEYLLVTVSLLTVFVMMYRSLQWYLSKQFTNGGVIILRMYKEDPW